MINLLPDMIKKDIKYAKHNVTLVKYLMILVLAILVIVSLMFFGSRTLSSSKTRIESALSDDRTRAAQLSPVHQQAKDLSATVDTIGSILDQEVRMSLLLQEIGSVMPDGAKLSSLNLSNETEEPIRLTVQLDTAEKAGVLQENLRESQIFAGADIINVSISGDGTAEYPYGSDIQAYYDPTFSLTDLGKPTEEAETP